MDASAFPRTRCAAARARARRARPLASSLGVAVALWLGALGCETPARAPSEQELRSPWAPRAPEPRAPHHHFADTSAPLSPGARHVVWFGHSLLVTDPDWPVAGEPALDLPALVHELHGAARVLGRTATPPGRSLTFAEGPHGFAYWLDGAGRAKSKLEALREVPWTDVVAVDLIHLLGQERFDWPTLYEWRGKLTGTREHSLRSRTRDVYRFIGLTRSVLPAARWVNYVAPALANNPAVQPSIDARFACIGAAARAQGATTRQAPVGAAFRSAEQHAAARGLAPLKLQHDDSLHLRPAGALLAALVLFGTIHGVDPSGLPVPTRYRGKLASSAEQERALATFLGEVASRALAADRSLCPRAARLPEDDEAAAWLAR